MPPTKEEKQDKTDQILGALSNLSTLVQDMGRRLGDVETKVKQQDMRSAKFQPMQTPEGLAKPRPRLEDLKKAEQYANGSKAMLVSASGIITPYAQRLYPDGTIVKFNPESETYQKLKAFREKGKGRFDPDVDEGVIISPHYINKDWQVKYRVRFDGLTSARGDGFYESELIPA